MQTLSIVFQSHSPASCRQRGGSSPTVDRMESSKHLVQASLGERVLHLRASFQLRFPTSICWPITTDQPFISARLTELNVAYELFEVRNSVLGLLPSLRLGGKAPSGNVATVREEAMIVLARAFGPDGRLKRKRAEKIRDSLDSSWDEGGHCYNDIRRLISLV